MRIGTVLVIGCLCLAAPGAVSAQTGAPAETRTDDELIADGIALRKQGLDAEALATFERAYAVRRSGRATAQIALAQQALSHWREAEAGLLAALRDADDRWVALYRKQLEQGLIAVQSHLAWLDVESNVAGAELWIDDRFVSRLPLENGVRVVAGDLAIEVRAAGLKPIPRHVTVEGNSHDHVAFVFASPVAAGEGSPVSPAPSAISGAASSRSRGAGLVALGAAGGLAAIGVAGVVTREVEASIWNDDQRCGPSGGKTRVDRCGANRQIGVTAETMGIAAFAGSGAALALAGWLLLRGDPPRTTGSTGRLDCGFTGTGVFCTEAF